MTTQTHTVATDALATIGNLIDETAGRDAIHLAVEPAVAGEHMFPCQRIKIVNGKAVPATADATGIVDPFLVKPVFPDQRFWLVVLPRTITSLRHVWSHPAFPDDEPAALPARDERSVSEAWMRAWAVKHMSEDYYGDDDTPRSEESAYASAIDAGHDLHIGPYEDARDYIDNEWWAHWEAITGKAGKRGEYFSCGC